MVGYDDNNDALTLGDDDSLKVGDYDLQYSSANDRFEVIDPDGNASYINRSQSGSLVPQGLAESVGAGEALADDGNTYSSVQTAVDNATGWVFVGPGTFNENVSIGTAGLTLEGSGYDTLIDSGININSSNVDINNLSVQSPAGGSTGTDGISVGSVNNTTIDSVRVLQSDDVGVGLSSSTNSTVTNCTIRNTDDIGIELGTSSVVIGCNIDDAGDTSIQINSNDNNIVSSNIVTNSGNNGIYVGRNDSIVSNNRVINSSQYGIRIFGTDTIIANNRVSDSTDADISDVGTGTVLDDNLTGASN